jgi:glycosyltransferase 2 family protein
MTRRVRLALQFVVSGGLIAYLLWTIDVGETADQLAASNVVYVLAAAAIYVSTLVPMALRWHVLLVSKGIHEPFGWLTKMYLIGYAASQVLPTGVGGDAIRIVEHARRRRTAKGEVAGAVLMERVVGSAALLLVAAIGLALAVGRYDNIGLVVWIEVPCVAVLLLAGLLLYSRRTNAFLQRHVFPRGAALRLQRPLSVVWTALHGYRWQRRALVLAFLTTVAVQFVRTFAIWLCGEAVGIGVSPLVYIILGPILFLVTMVPVTVNGLGVRESFFVLFLGRFGVAPDAAFAVGFLFFAITIAAALPGGFVLAWRSVRGGVGSARRHERAQAETS